MVKFKLLLYDESDEESIVLNNGSQLKAEVTTSAGSVKEENNYIHYK